jgi:hypothetical protein
VLSEKGASPVQPTHLYIRPVRTLDECTGKKLDEWLIRAAVICGRMESELM